MKKSRYTEEQIIGILKQHEECGHGPIHRGGWSHRLHTREFHREQAALRRILRLHWAIFVVGVKERLE
jgi:hypothetical protein